MKDTINKIIDIDDSAKKIIYRAREKSEEILFNAQQTGEEIKKSAREHAEVQLSKIEDAQKEETEKKIKAINLRKQQRIEKIEDCFKESEAKWIKKIVSDITGG